MSYNTAFDKFMSEAFEDAVNSSTQASWSGSGYSVELFENGSYRVLWNNNIGNLYDSPGVILGVPSLSDEEWDDDSDLRFYDNAEEEIRDNYKELLEKIAAELT